MLYHNKSAVISVVVCACLGVCALYYVSINNTQLVTIFKAFCKLGFNFNNFIFM